MRERLLGYIPRGDTLTDEAWTARHRAIRAVLWLHVPGIAVFALLAGFGPLHSFAEALPVLVLAVLSGSLSKTRGVAASLATTGLITCSALAVHISGGLIEAHFHFFVMVGIVTLYQQWTPFLVAIAYVVLHHGIMGALHPEAVFNHPAAIVRPWTWAAVHGGFVLAASLVGLIAWKLNEDAQAAARESYRQLYEGERAIAQRLREADQAKEDLVSVVSHEFRTPLTAIVGYGDMLLRHDERLDATTRRDVTKRLLRQSRRLQHLIENLLHASRISEVPTDGCTAVAQVVHQVVSEDLGVASGSGSRIVSVMDDGLHAGVDPEVLRIVVGNLVGNARKFSAAGTEIVVRAFSEGPQVALSVTNETHDLDQRDLERIFEPFVQLDPSPTREASGVGLGLHIVRRLVHAAGGSIDVRLEGRSVTFVVRLPSTDPEPELEITQRAVAQW
ncbi:MAG TPA: HAMP domain-containing sensor histidine kinase [Actinomycetota bacterium]|nr:HAMP domain-containing sensor histidine kinase [Actinomycetota bacterium]